MKMTDPRKQLKFAAYCTCAMLFAASTSFAQTNGWPTVEPQGQQTAQAADPNQAPPPPAPDQNENNSQPQFNNQNPYSNQPPYNNQAPPPQYNQGPQYSNQAPQYGNGPQYNGAPQYGQRPPYGQNPNPYAQQAPPPPVPAELTLAPGTYVTVRINQKLSSDHSKQGDAFTATLVEPVVVNGIVVAEPGQTVGGVVANVEKGSTSKLLIQLTDLSLVDGQRLPIQTQLVARRGPGFTGADAGTIVGTTAVGAAIGAAAGWGTGAAIGGVAGLTVGALITHNHPSVIYPEQVLTFRVQTAQTISTQNAPQAFRYVEPGEYDRPAAPNGPTMAYAPSAPYYAYPYAYPYPYYWGPTFGFAYFGGPYYRGYYARPYFYGRGAVVVRHR
jgi:hypothetical protein